VQDTDAQQVELGTAIHLALEVLEPVDLAFDLTAAPGRTEGGTHGRQVGLETDGEALQVGRCVRTRLRQPAIEALGIAVSHQAEQAQRQFTRDSNRRLDGAEDLHELMPVTVLARRELALLPPQYPGERTTRRRR